MKRFPRSLAIAAISGGTVAAIFSAPEFVRFNNTARAEDAPAQGKVQAPVQASPQEQQQLESLASIFRKVGKTVEPSVVQIDVMKTTKVARPRGYEEQLRRFFDRDNDGQFEVPDGLNDGTEEFQQQGTGSGVIMEVNGSDVYILTNNHVAGGASQLSVRLFNGTVVEGGSVVGTDPKTDLAIVKIKQDGLVAAPWGNSDELEKGDWILAFGSPFNFVGSMTHGIVSATNRQAGILGPNGYENFIQVDAPINPGNSGGPLVNTRGQVVGINTAIASRSGGFQGIGFAIPSNQAKSVYTSLKNTGKVVRGYIGVSIRDASSLEAETRQAIGFTNHDGVFVRETYVNTPSTGKLQAGDVITALGGKPVKNAQELRNTIAATAPGTNLKVTVFRRGKTEDVTIKIGEQPEDMLAAMGGGQSGEGGVVRPDSDNVLGMKLATPNDALAKEYSLGDLRKGAVVTEIDPRSAAARTDLKKGDVITRVGDQEVSNVKEATEAIHKMDPKKPIALWVSTAQASRVVVIRPTGS